MLLAIDHGNKLIKTRTSTFSSGLTKSSEKPPFGDRILHYKNNFYTVSDTQRIPYKRDKTRTEDFFVLSLFAIADELLHQNVLSFGEVNLQLAIGLPPSHFKELYRRFEAYFLNRGLIEFTLDKQYFRVRIDKATAYPQAFAAYVTIHSQLRDKPKITVLDIGGYTLDYLKIEKGKPDLDAYESIERGCIKLYHLIEKRVNAEKGYQITENDIDDILLRGERIYPMDIIDLVYDLGRNFTLQLVQQLREREIDITMAKTVFMGGGSILLQQFLQEIPDFSDSIFVDDISANVKGYQVLAEIMNEG